jgi:DNA-binding MarR family transcriptional regulator
MSTSLTYFQGAGLNSSAPKGTAQMPESDRMRSASPDMALIELVFFGYRDFVGEPDRVLARYGFGRAHHRVLHFVNRQPGLTIAALLDILGITKQSLARVLKELVEGGFIDAREGSADRRQRLLYLTPQGATLSQELAERQGRRIDDALKEAGPNSREIVARFLTGLIEPTQRDHIRAMIRTGKT